MLGLVFLGIPLLYWAGGALLTAMAFAPGSPAGVGCKCAIEPPGKKDATETEDDQDASVNDPDDAGNSDASDFRCNGDSYECDGGKKPDSGLDAGDAGESDSGQDAGDAGRDTGDAGRPDANDTDASFPPDGGDEPDASIPPDGGKVPDAGDISPDGGETTDGGDEPDAGYVPPTGVECFSPPPFLNTIDCDTKTNGRWLLGSAPSVLKWCDAFDRCTVKANLKCEDPNSAGHVEKNISELGLEPVAYLSIENQDGPVGLGLVTAGNPSTGNPIAQILVDELASDPEDAIVSCEIIHQIVDLQSGWHFEPSFIGHPAASLQLVPDGPKWCYFSPTTNYDTVHHRTNESTIIKECSETYDQLDMKFLGFANGVNTTTLQNATITENSHERPVILAQNACTATPAADECAASVTVLDPNLNVINQYEIGEVYASLLNEMAVDSSGHRLFIPTEGADHSIYTLNFETGGVDSTDMTSVAEGIIFAIETGDDNNVYLADNGRHVIFMDMAGHQYLGRLQLPESAQVMCRSGSTLFTYSDNFFCKVNLGTAVPIR